MSVNRPQDARWAAAATFAAVSLVAAPAFAAEGSLGLSMFGYWVNFAIFIAILVKFGKGPIQQHFKSRHESLVADLDAAKKLRIEAEERLAELQGKLDKLDGERDALLAEYREQGRREKDRIIADTKKQIAKMRTDAETQIAQDVRRAKALIEERAVDAAVELATSLATSRIDGDVQNGLMRAYVEDLKTITPAN